MAALAVFAVVGIAIAAASAPQPDGPGSSQEPGPSASAGTGNGTTERVEVASIAVDVPPGWTAQLTEPDAIQLQNLDLLALVDLTVISTGTSSLEQVVGLIRDGITSPSLICRDEATALPNVSLPAHRVDACTPTQGAHDIVRAALVAVAGDRGLLVVISGGGPIPFAEQLPAIESMILPTIQWKVLDGGAGTGAVSPTPSPTSTPIPDGSFCAPVTAGTWTPQTLLGKSVEVAAVPIPNAGTNLFEGGRIRLVNVLGDTGGYATVDEADAVAQAAFTQYDAAVLRQLVVVHDGRFYAYEGRAHVTSIGAYDPPPCRIPEVDGRVERWRAGRFLTSPDLTYSGWVYYVWTPSSQDYCATDNIRLYYPAIRQCP